MITREIKINGQLISHLYVRNLTINIDARECPYEYEYYEVRKGVVQYGNVTHVREEGADKLIKIIMLDIEKKKRAKARRDRNKTTAPAGKVLNVTEGKKSGQKR